MRSQDLNKDHEGRKEELHFSRNCFPYEPPSQELLERYGHLLDSSRPRIRLGKRVFDIVLASLVLIVYLPILGVIFFATLIEQFFYSDSRGSFFTKYKAVSRGEEFDKIKIRVVKERYFDLRFPEGDWRRYSGEWGSDSLTRVGKVVKNFYLDEIPQFFSVLSGSMSLVGPRPLSVIHYNHDLAQGNFPRMLIPGGMLGLGHIRKGTESFGLPDFEFEYLRIYCEGTVFELLVQDVLIIWRGVLLILKGGGH